MRRVVVILSVLGMVGFVAATPALATPVYAFVANNYMNACGSYPWIAHDADTAYFMDPVTGPLVAQDGLVWLKKSSGNWSNGSPYELFTPNLESWGLRTTVSVQTAAGWQIVDDGVCNNGGYAGYFVNAANQINLPSNVLLTGLDTVPHDTHPESYGGYFQEVTAKLQMWIDPALQAGGNSPYATYAQAAAASHPGSGVFVAQATFQVDVQDITGAPLDWPNWMGMRMPAMVLQEQVPEPATFVLVATGLLGFAAYTWRRRK